MWARPAPPSPLPLEVGCRGVCGHPPPRHTTHPEYDSQRLLLTSAEVELPGEIQREISKSIWSPTGGGVLKHKPHSRPWLGMWWWGEDENEGNLDFIFSLNGTVEETSICQDPGARLRRQPNRWTPAPTVQQAEKSLPDPSSPLRVGNRF